MRAGVMGAKTHRQVAFSPSWKNDETAVLLPQSFLRSKNSPLPVCTRRTGGLHAFIIAQEDPEQASRAREDFVCASAGRTALSVGKAGRNVERNRKERMNRRKKQYDAIQIHHPKRDAQGLCRGGKPGAGGVLGRVRSRVRRAPDCPQAAREGCLPRRPFLRGSGRKRTHRRADSLYQSPN